MLSLRAAHRCPMENAGRGYVRPNRRKHFVHVIPLSFGYGRVLPLYGLESVLPSTSQVLRLHGISVGYLPLHEHHLRPFFLLESANHQSSLRPPHFHSCHYSVAMRSTSAMEVTPCKTSFAAPIRNVVIPSLKATF